MIDYKQRFLELALHRKALKFGEFELKSGRISPYFFNLGAFNQASDLLALGECYAAAIVDRKLDCDTLFGPAYKGIPLVVATAAELARAHDRDLPWCFNRKEAKQHGEGGNMVGAKPAGRVLIIDDVITAGTAIRQAIGDIRQAGGKPSAVVVALDRQERGESELSALAEVRRSFGISVEAIVSLADVIEWVKGRDDLGEHLAAIERYRDQYGV